MFAALFVPVCWWPLFCPCSASRLWPTVRTYVLNLIGSGRFIIHCQWFPARFGRDCDLHPRGFVAPPEIFLPAELSYSCAWAPPPVGVVKINFYGATRGEPTLVGAGVVARDSSGKCLAWLSVHWAHFSSSALAEALSARLAVEMSLEFGWPSVLVEGDCATLIRLLRAGVVPFSLDRPIILDIVVLARGIPRIEFLFSGRMISRAAHVIASISFRSPTALPSSVLNLLYLDYDMNE
ncbi:hypothetical protein KSP39_PZI020408 [Platanthera zijinensis]|uniref:RNase H type-1 domain-containing protein n=1 Tax=Platanthera zijinensis TaxID=2320716 RepID=A0AAP0FXB8_9ASPA